MWYRPLPAALAIGALAVLVFFVIKPFALKKSSPFSVNCPDPLWLDKSAPTGSAIGELQALFQQRLAGGMPRKDLPSVGFLSMQRSPDNQPVAFYSLMLVAQGAEYPALEGCASYFFEKYSSAPTQSDPNLFAGAVGQVSQALLKGGNARGAAKLLEPLYKNYSRKIPESMTQAYGYYYAEALAKTDRRDEAIVVLKDLIENFETREEVRLRSLLTDLQK